MCRTEPAFSSSLANLLIIIVGFTVDDADSDSAVAGAAGAAAARGGRRFYLVLTLTLISLDAVKLN